MLKNTIFIRERYKSGTPRAESKEHLSLEYLERFWIKHLGRKMVDIRMVIGWVIEKKTFNLTTILKGGYIEWKVLSI